MKIFCENCGHMIDTEKETKCGKCGTFYDRSIFRTKHGCTDEKSCHPRGDKHNYDYDYDYDYDDHHDNNKEVEYKVYNGKKVTVIKEKGNIRTVQSKKVPKVVLTFILIFFGIQFLIPIITAISVFIGMFSITDGFVDMVEQDYNMGEHFETESNYGIDYNLALDFGEKLNNYPYAKEDFDYYKFTLHIDNISENELELEDIKGFVDGEEIGRIFWGDGEQNINSFWIEPGVVHKEIVIFEVPKNTDKITIKYGDTERIIENLDF